jgi:hypothetical protein
MIEQGSKEWFLSRLGKFTGSVIGDLMTKGKTKDKLFGDKAMTLIYKVASERCLIPAYLEDDYLWEVYQNQVSFSNKYTQFGQENEGLAIEVYESIKGITCEEVPSVQHPTIPTFAASPDRLVTIDDERIVCEVKCPKPEVFMEYKHKIVDNESLKAVESKYFYQVQAEMMCTGCKQADFIVFCPFLKPNIHIVRITADEEVQKEIENRIVEAEKIIESILKK